MVAPLEPPWAVEPHAELSQNFAPPSPSSAVPLGEAAQHVGSGAVWFCLGSINCVNLDRCIGLSVPVSLIFKMRLIMVP